MRFFLCVGSVCLQPTHLTFAHHYEQAMRYPHLVFSFRTTLGLSGGTSLNNLSGFFLVFCKNFNVKKEHGEI